MSSRVNIPNQSLAPDPVLSNLLALELNAGEGALFVGGKMHTREQRRKYYYTQFRKPRGVLNRFYHRQVVSSRRRSRPAPTYTFEQLAARFENDPLFKKLFRAWVASGFKRPLTPSIDRIDCKKPYSLGNIQIMTQAENANKSYWEWKYRNVRSKPVIQIKDGVTINRFISLGEAARKSPLSKSALQRRIRIGIEWQYESSRRNQLAKPAAIRQSV